MGWIPPAVETQRLFDCLVNTAEAPLEVVVPTVGVIAEDFHYHGNSGLDNDLNFHQRLQAIQRWFEEVLSSTGDKPSASSCFHKFLKCDTYGYGSVSAKTSLDLTFMETSWCGQYSDIYPGGLQDRGVVMLGL